MTTSADSSDLSLQRLGRDPVLLLALGFGAGLAPKAPGTWGTLIALPFCWLAQYQLSAPSYALLTLALFILGVVLCEYACRALGAHDHPAIVWDEIVGLFITLIAAPSGWLWLAIGFALFRLFDIVKPWPVSLADRHLPGGFGVMADDVLAAGYAWLSLQALAVLLGSGG